MVAMVECLMLLLAQSGVNTSVILKMVPSSLAAVFLIMYSQAAKQMQQPSLPSSLSCTRQDGSSQPDASKSMAHTIALFFNKHISTSVRMCFATATMI